MPGLGHHSALLFTLQEAYAFAFIFASVRHSGRTALPSQPPSILPRAKDEKGSLYPELRHLDHPECKGV